MLADAYKECYDTLTGTLDGCSVFEASRDKVKADACVSTGDVVTEVHYLLVLRTRFTYETPS